MSSIWHEDKPDPLDGFLAQLLKDFPDVPLTPTTVAPSLTLTLPLSVSSFPLPPSSSPSSSSSSSPSSSAPWLPWSLSSLILPSPHLTARSRYRDPDVRLICQWASSHGSHDSPVICGTSLPEDPKVISVHFRKEHGVHGNEKVIISCQWRDCRALPMQRGSLIRHILTVHLGLLKWRCGRCRKTFSRKGTTHTCQA